MLLKIKITDISISSLNLAEAKFSKVGFVPAAMFVMSSANFTCCKSFALSPDPLDDHTMPHVEVRKYYCNEPP